jgi:hypothetical protein
MNMRDVLKAAAVIIVVVVMIEFLVCKGKMIDAQAQRDAAGIPAPVKAAMKHEDATEIAQNRHDAAVRELRTAQASGSDYDVLQAELRLHAIEQDKGWQK